MQFTHLYTFFCFFCHCPEIWCLVFVNLKRSVPQRTCSFRWVVCLCSEVWWPLFRINVQLEILQKHPFIIIIMLPKELSSEFKELDWPDSFSPPTALRKISGKIISQFQWKIKAWKSYVTSPEWCISATKLDLFLSLSSYCDLLIFIGYTMQSGI